MAVFLQIICIKFLAFEKAYFGQHLECAAPKRWSQYTTIVKLLNLELMMTSYLFEIDPSKIDQ